MNGIIDDFIFFGGGGGYSTMQSFSKEVLWWGFISCKTTLWGWLCIVQVFPQPPQQALFQEEPENFERKNLKKCKKVSYDDRKWRDRFVLEKRSKTRISSNLPHGDEARPSCPLYASKSQVQPKAQRLTGSIYWFHHRLNGSQVQHMGSNSTIVGPEV